MIDDPRADDDPQAPVPDFDSPPDDSDFSPAHLDLSLASWRTPLSLRIIALVFILAGILGILEMFLQSIVRGGFHVDIMSLLLLFTGRGLLLWQPGWQKFARFVFALTILGGATGMLLSLNEFYSGDGGLETRVGPISGGAGLGLLVGIAVIALGTWGLRVLSRPEIEWRFNNRLLNDALHERSWNPLRWRFSLRSMFLMTIFVAIVLVRVTAEDVWYDTSQSGMTQTRGQTTQSVDYAVLTSRFSAARRKLKYVVMSNGQQQISYVWDGNGDRKRLTVVNREDGSRLEIPTGSRQLHEIVDGELRTRDERVTLAEFEDFLHSHSGDWSLDALVKHAKAFRERQISDNESADLPSR